MRYRSGTDIISEILEAANGSSATRTKIILAYLFTIERVSDACN
jgi:predicted transcriptional regulator